MAPKILIVDDHPLFRGALRLAAAGAFADGEILEAAEFDAALASVAANPDIDIVLLDLNLPGVRGFSGLMAMRAQHPAIPVVIVSGNAEASSANMAMQFGAAGFVPKTCGTETLRHALRTVAEGGVWFPEGTAAGGVSDGESAGMAKKIARLTPQQLRVLTMLSDGLLNKQIAYALDVSEATVKAHVSAILQKLDVDSRTQAVIAANRTLTLGSSSISQI